MVDQRTLIHDSGRFPLVVRLPSVAFGLLSLALAVETLTDHLYARRLLFGTPSEPLSAGVTIAVVSVLILLAFVFANVWSFRRRWVFAPDDGLLFELAWLGGAVRRTTPLGDIAAIEVKPLLGPRVANADWRVQVRLRNNGLIFVQETSEAAAVALAEKLAGIVGVSCVSPR